MKKDLPSSDLQAVSAYLSGQADVVVAYLFGSVARGEATAGSDVDLALLLDPQLSPRERLERQLDLLVALDELCAREVQITLLNTAPPLLAYQVLREGQLLYERTSGERVAFEVRAMKRYFDVKPMLDFYRERLVRRLQKGERREPSERHRARALEAAERIRQRLAGTTGD